MKRFVCEMCGSNDLQKENDIIICKYCGTQYLSEENQKKSNEGVSSVSCGVVKIDSREKIENLHILAERALQEENYEKAANFYDEILRYSPNDYEAVFFSVYCAERECSLDDVFSSGQKILRAFTTAIDLLKNKEDFDAESFSLACEMLADYISIFAFDALGDIYESYAKVSEIYFLGKMMITVANELYRVDEKKLAAEYYKDAQKIFGDKYSLDEAYILRIREYYADYQIFEKKSGCYIATCVYGSYNCPQVWTLRRYRDNTLGATWYGRVFIKLYYAISPTLVKWFGHTKWFKKMWKGKLDRMVKKLNDKGVEDTPYYDNYL